MTTETTACDVAYQGVPGAFGHEAAIGFAGADASMMACRSFSDVFAATRDGRAKLGVVPIENTLAGSVHETYDLLGRSSLAIVDERVIRISHALIAPPGVALANVVSVSSHPMALAQCEGFFRAHATMTPIAAFNTAGAVAEMIASGARDVAAIASKRAAALHGGVVLLDGIEDHAQNFTRFLLIAADGSTRVDGVAQERKTSLVLTLAHRPGTLAAVLAAFAARDVDLSKIESRPVHGRPFEYVFYLDVRGDRDDPTLRAAIADAEASTTSLRILGSYPDTATTARV